MANRRTLGGYDQSSLMQPSSPMSPAGAKPVAQDAEALPYDEHPDTRRRRLTPMTGTVEPNPSTMQALLAMFGAQ